MAALRAYLRAVDRLSELVGMAMSVLAPLMVLVLVWEVVSRYVFGAPTIWAYDTAIFLFGYIGLLAGANVMRQRQHINVDLVYNLFPPRGRAVLDVIGGLLVFFFLGLVVVYGWGAAIDAIRHGARRSTEWAPPVGHFMLMIPVGAFLLLLQASANWLRSLHVALTGRAVTP